MTEREQFWKEQSTKAKEWLHKNYKWPQTNDEAELIMLLAAYGQASAREQMEQDSKLAEKKFAAERYNRHDSVPFNTGRAIGAAIRESFEREAGKP